MLQKTAYKRLDIHLLVVAGYNHGDRAMQLLVLGHADGWPGKVARRVLGLDQDDACEAANAGCVLQNQAQVLGDEHQPTRHRPVEEIVSRRTDADKT